MKTNGLLMTCIKIFDTELHRAIKIGTGLKNLKLLPDGRAKEHVTPEQAAHLIRVMAIDLNPVSEKFERRVSEFQLLRNGKDFFINDFRDILSGEVMMDRDAGMRGEKNLCDAFHRISFSLKRPFVTIVWRRYECCIDAQGEKRQSAEFEEVEVVYGEKLEPLPFERFAILKRSIIEELVIHVSGHQMYGTIHSETGTNISK